MINSLSIIFPVFNEQSRIKNSLNKIKKFIKFSKLKYIEIIFIDDGSTDKTYSIIKNFISTFKNNKKNRLLLLNNYKNFGKGHSLRKGIIHSRADWILTADIDLSVNINQYQKWFLNRESQKKFFIYFGSRNHPNSKVQKTLPRYLLGQIFRFIIYFLFKIKFYDTQCGYKLYKNTIAKKIFFKLKDDRFAHDVEIILLANFMKILIKEMPVDWVHKNHSKVNIFRDVFIMFWDLLMIKKRFLNKI
jgi:dolichyl-phosphate beta-glucosyltransferase